MGKNSPETAFLQDLKPALRDGKQLSSWTKDSDSISYAYDENGLRLRKTVNGTQTEYYYNGSLLMSMVSGDDTLLFSYDQGGNVVSVNYNGTEYYYLRNGQNDIVKLIDGSGTAVVTYGYDSWGRLISCDGSLAATLGTLNPFRYRGYVYDEETGLYYLQSRYYDPELCRFISSDVLLSTGQGVIGCNAFAYCLNSPVVNYDPNGMMLVPVYNAELSGGSNDIEEDYNSNPQIGLMSKSKGRGRDSGLRDYTNDEIDEMYKNTPPGKERDRLKREQKNRNTRNKQKRISNFDNQYAVEPKFYVTDSFNRLDGAQLLVGIIFTLVLIADDIWGAGVADDCLLPVAMEMIKKGVCY